MSTGMMSPARVRYLGYRTRAGDIIPVEAVGDVDGNDVARARPVAEVLGVHAALLERLGQHGFALRSAGGSVGPEVPDVLADDLFARIARELDLRAIGLENLQSLGVYHAHDRCRLVDDGAEALLILHESLLFPDVMEESGHDPHAQHDEDGVAQPHLPEELKSPWTQHGQGRQQGKG